MTQPSWRIVMFSNLGPFAPMFEQMLGAFGHRLVGVVTSPGPAKNRTTSYLEIVRGIRPGIDVIVSTHPHRWEEMLKPLRPDLILSIGFPWLIPDNVLAMPPLGAINVHASSLPKYRGPNPVGWAFRNGDRELGMTIHRLDHQFDTGHILATGSIPIDDNDDFSTAGQTYAGLIGGLLATAFERVAQGDPGDPQPADGASEAPFFEEAWRQIDWNAPARTIHNQVRSWTGDRGIPRGAIGTIDGEPTLVMRTRLVTGAQSSAGAGSVIGREGDVIRIQCGDGPLDIIEHQPGS